MEWANVGRNLILTGEGDFREKDIIYRSDDIVKTKVPEYLLPDHTRSFIFKLPYKREKYKIK